MSKPFHNNSDSEINASEDPSLISRDFTGLWIPRSIWLHPQLSAMEKCLWAEINSLYSRKEKIHGCYASEKYLCDFMGVKRSRLYEMFTKLKDLGLLKDVAFDGRTKIRQAIEYKQDEETGGQQTSGKPDSRGAENRTDTLYIRAKKENKDIYKAKPSTKKPSSSQSPPPSASLQDTKTSSFSFVSPDLLEEKDCKKGTVSCSEIEWKALVEKMGEAIAKELAYKISRTVALDNYKLKSLYHTILKWHEMNLQRFPKVKEKSEKPDWLRPEMCKGQIFECEDFIKE